MRKLMLTAALLAIAACAPNRPPAPAASSHPPALDLVCAGEPAALTDAQVLADEESGAQGLGHPNEEAFNDAALLAGRSCRDSLKRVCEWHKARGDKALNCEVSMLAPRELGLLRDRLLRLAG